MENEISNDAETKAIVSKVVADFDASFAPVETAKKQTGMQWLWWVVGGGVAVAAAIVLIKTVGGKR